ncbi:pilus assembly protein PilM [Phycisphaerales bacterium AB-hyl4]|uniref:Pilus assembly protein PilM n=1 Tax=Natronomicrosphaera hydrolytica TaxID=3242702 RepID=A0ABV4U1Y9_9BACT
MVFSFSTTRSAIGVDIGSRYVKAAQLSYGRDGVAKLSAGLVLERESPAEVFSADEACRLMTVLDRRGFVGRELVATVPSESLMTSLLTLPPRGSGAPLTEIATAEMARTHRVDADALEVAYWDLPSGAKPDVTPVMAAACRHEHAEALLDALEWPGFEVLALDAEGWALCRAARTWMTAEQPLAAAIDIGWRGVNFVLLHGASVVYERTLGGTGMHALSEMIHREQALEQPVIDYLLGQVGLSRDSDTVDPDDLRLAERLRGPLEQHVDALVQELRLSVSYATHQYPNATLDRLLLSGGGAMVRGLAEQLGQALEMEAVVMTPSAICQPTVRGLNESAEASLSVALGLAMYPRQADGQSEEAA